MGTPRSGRVEVFRFWRCINVGDLWRSAVLDPASTVKNHQHERGHNAARNPLDEVLHLEYAILQNRHEDSQWPFFLVIATIIAGFVVRAICTRKRTPLSHSAPSCRKIHVGTHHPALNPMLNSMFMRWFVVPLHPLEFRSGICCRLGVACAWGIGNVQFRWPFYALPSHPSCLCSFVSPMPHLLMYPWWLWVERETYTFGRRHLGNRKTSKCAFGCGGSDDLDCSLVLLSSGLQFLVVWRTATPAERMGLVVAFTEGGGSLCHLELRRWIWC